MSRSPKNFGQGPSSNVLPLVCYVRTCLCQVFSHCEYINETLTIIFHCYLHYYNHPTWCLQQFLITIDFAFYVIVKVSAFCNLYIQFTGIFLCGMVEFKNAIGRRAQKGGFTVSIWFNHNKFKQCLISRISFPGFSFDTKGPIVADGDRRRCAQAIPGSDLIKTMLW